MSLDFLNWCLYFIFICQHFFDFLSNTRYQNILSMKPWDSNLQDRFICDNGPYVLLFSVRKTTCPRDQDGVLKISRLLHLSFTWNKGYFFIFYVMINKLLLFTNAICNKYNFHMRGTQPSGFSVFMIALLRWVLLCHSIVDQKQFIYLII